MATLAEPHTHLYFLERLFLTQFCVVVNLIGVVIAGSVDVAHACLFFYEIDAVVRYHTTLEHPLGGILRWPFVILCY